MITSQQHSVVGGGDHGTILFHGSGAHDPLEVYEVEQNHDDANELQESEVWVRSHVKSGLVSPCRLKYENEN